MIKCINHLTKLYYRNLLDKPDYLTHPPEGLLFFFCLDTCSSTE